MKFMSGEKQDLNRNIVESKVFADSEEEFNDTDLNRNIVESKGIKCQVYIILRFNLNRNIVESKGDYNRSISRFIIILIET